MAMGVSRSTSALRRARPIFFSVPGHVSRSGSRMCTSVRVAGDHVRQIFLQQPFAQVLLQEALPAQDAARVQLQQGAGLTQLPAKPQSRCRGGCSSHVCDQRLPAGPPAPGPQPPGISAALCRFSRTPPADASALPRGRRLPSSSRCERSGRSGTPCCRNGVGAGRLPPPALCTSSQVLLAALVFFGLSNMSARRWGVRQMVRTPCSASIRSSSRLSSRS